MEDVIGLLLGTEEDWPTAFEALIGCLGSVGGMRRFAIVQDRGDRIGRTQLADLREQITFASLRIESESASKLH